MNQTAIEWCDFSINPVKGLCPVSCPYCYARRMYKRFKWDETIRYEPEMFNDIYKLDLGKRIFVGSTMELFGNWIKDVWMEEILKICDRCSEHTFIFLTKKPVGLRKWSPFPKNVWIGVSTTGFDNNSYLEDIFRPIEATVKFVSIEPLLDYSPMDFRWVNWVIVGRQTPLYQATMPSMNWIHDIVTRADEARVPIFLKNNLRSLIPDEIPLFNKNQYQLRQEFPNVKV